MNLRSEFLQQFPNTITILPTYRCNAACEQCCFESNPDVEGRLSLTEIEGIINRSVAAFPGLKLIAFSGGECTLIKDDLYSAVRLVSSHKLLSRVVTNAGWGKSKQHASRVASELKAAGLCEANISTGKDHQRWVPLESVVNAAHALISEGISTLVTVEADTETSDCLNACKTHPVVVELLHRDKNPLQLMTNVWMPFNSGHSERTGQKPKQGGCQQLFHNIVFTPHREVSACCGLTFEHIPELKIGTIAEHESFSEFFLEQLDDFLKIWIHVEGPKAIALALLGDEGEQLLQGSVHICQSCVLIHQHEVFRQALRRDYQQHIPRVMSKFFSKALLASVEAGRSPLAVQMEA